MTPDKVEFKDIAVVGGALALTGLGLYFGLKKPAVPGRVKRGGDPVEASITFYGRGNAGTYQVGFGISKGKLIGHEEILEFYVQKLQLDLTDEWKKFGPFKVGGSLPTVITSGKLDVFLFIQTEIGELRSDASGFLPGSRWIDDVYEIREET